MALLPLRRRTSRILAVAFAVGLLACLGLAVPAIARDPALGVVVAACIGLFAWRGHDTLGGRGIAAVHGGVLGVIVAAGRALYDVGLPAWLAVAIAGAVIATGIVIAFRAMLAGASADDPYID